MKRFVFLLAGVVLFSACATPRGRLPTPPTEPPVVEKKDLWSHVEGKWERVIRGGKGGRMIFSKDGSLTFQGAMESCNPGLWTLDVAAKELQITLPQAPDDTIAIFKMYLKDGVKSVDRVSKRVTYHFDEDTSDLNIAGWVYNKTDQEIIRMEPQPELE